jgi:hypothetical protein
VLELHLDLSLTVEVVDDLIGVDPPLGDLVPVVVVDVDAFGQDHLDVSVQVMHHCELEGHWKGLLHQLTDVLDLFLSVLILSRDLHHSPCTFALLLLRYSLVSSTNSSRLEQ